MGLASALTTALTGLTAAETQLDVVGNNLANSQTAGFKASKAMFATQFLQTQGLGSAPTETTGGTNPRQTGLGTQVAEISPDFSQGTIEISSNPSDLAIQGDGFFIVEGPGGETLYTRNGRFKTNSQNELVTITGHRLLGYAVDDSFELQTTHVTQLTIPLGAAAVAKATETVHLEGTLSPSGEVADTAEVVESAVLSDAAVARPSLTGDIDGDGVPDVPPVDVDVAPVPDSSTAGTATIGGGTLAQGDTYGYRITFVDDSGTETLASDPINVTVAGNPGNVNAVQLSNLPTSTDYSLMNVYRTAAGGSDYYLLMQNVAMTGTIVDDGSVALSGTPLESQTAINGNYSYLVTFFKTGQEESRPSLLIGPTNVSSSRLHLSNLPTPDPSGIPAYNKVRIYRNLASDSSSYYLVDTVDPGQSYTDTRSDAEISDLTDPNNQMIDMEGPRIDSNTLLTNVLRRDGLDFEQVFDQGTLTFTAKKGGRSLTPKQFTIAADSTVQELIDFMQEVMGIQVAADDPQNPIPGSVNNIPGESTDLAQGATIQDGKIRIVSNNGLDNAVEISLSAFQLDKLDGTVSAPNVQFGSIQEAVGESAVTDFVVYDSLGIPLTARLTAVLESRTGTMTTYRWFADSPDNDPATGVETAVGTGLVSFDGQGNLVSTTNATVSIDRRNIPSTSPLEFDFDFSQISGLDTGDSESFVSAFRQDGFGTGKLTSFIIGEDGVIRGVFTNGASRQLGQVRLARFGNAPGLEQRGQNLFAAGVNSGLAVEGNPGSEGIGTIIAGAVELSNTDIGKNLIELVLATTQYRGNTRVITAAQQLLDELLNLRR